MAGPILPPNSQKSKKKMIKERLFQLAIILVIIAFIGVLVIAVLKKAAKQPEDHFVHYDNATTLVIIYYGKRTFLGYDSIAGFIDDDIYEEYKKDMLQKKGIIEIYHPYKRGDTFVVDVDEIVQIKIKTYATFYDGYPPEDYRIYFE